MDPSGIDGDSADAPCAASGANVHDRCGRCRHGPGCPRAWCRFHTLYDGGSNDDLARGPGNWMLVYLQTFAPTVTTIDHVILSHPHRDHVELLPDLFDTYDVRQVCGPDPIQWTVSLS